MQLHINTITHTLFDGPAQGVSVPTPTGLITILDHHIPLISLLTKGTVDILNERGQSIPIQGGLIEVRADNHVIILAESIAS